jgi:hypothetical protein
MTGEATLNVLNLKDFTGNDKQGLGLLELHLGGDKGISANLGTGGTDVSYGALASAVSGLRNWEKNIEIENRADILEMDIGTALRAQWGYGEEAAKAQLEAILNGDAVVRAGNGIRGAETVLENGKRVIFLNEYQEGMSIAGQLMLGIDLQHEAYRDGYTPGGTDANGNLVTTESNMIENRPAVLAHTEMAIRMLQDGQGLDTSGALGKDLAMYEYARSSDDMSLMDWYADTFYNSDRDYKDWTDIFKSVTIADVWTFITSDTEGKFRLGAEKLARGLAGEEEYNQAMQTYQNRPIPDVHSDSIKPLPAEGERIEFHFLSDTINGFLDSNSDRIENMAVKLGLTKESLSVMALNGFRNFIDRVESGNNNFSFLQGFIAYNRTRDFDFIGTTGNFINTFPSVGFYGNNLFTEGDKFSVTFNVSGNFSGLLKANIAFTLLADYRW